MDVRDDDSQDRKSAFCFFLTMFSAHVVWCRRTDELVDGPNASRIAPTALDRWEARLEDLFQGRPFDMMDAALADTVAKFPVDIQVRQYFKIKLHLNWKIITLLPIKNIFGVAMYRVCRILQYISISNV